MATDLNNGMLEIRKKRFRERLETIEKETGLTLMTVLSYQPNGIIPVLHLEETKNLKAP